MTQVDPDDGLPDGVSVEVTEQTVSIQLRVNTQRLALYAAATGKSPRDLVRDELSRSEDSLANFLEQLSALEQLTDEQLARECLSDALFRYGTFFDGADWEDNPSLQECLDNWWSGEETPECRQLLSDAAAAAQRLEFPEARALCLRAVTLGQWKDMFADEDD